MQITIRPTRIRWEATRYYSGPFEDPFWGVTKQIMFLGHTDTSSPGRPRLPTLVWLGQAGLLRRLVVVGLTAGRPESDAAQAESDRIVHILV